MGGSCCEKKVLCNRPPSCAPPCHKEKCDPCRGHKDKCCDYKEKHCGHKNKCCCYKGKYYDCRDKYCGCKKEEKCLTASDLACLIERYRNRVPPFPPTPPTPPVPPPPVPPPPGPLSNTIAFPAETSITKANTESDIYYFRVCINSGLNPPYSVRFRVSNGVGGYSPYYEGIIAASSDACTTGFISYDVVFTSGAFDALLSAQYIGASGSNYYFTQPGQVTF